MLRRCTGWANGGRGRRPSVHCQRSAHRDSSGGRHRPGRSAGASPLGGGAPGGEFNGWPEGELPAGRGDGALRDRAEIQRQAECNRSAKADVEQGRTMAKSPTPQAKDTHYKAGWGATWPRGSAAGMAHTISRGTSSNKDHMPGTSHHCITNRADQGFVNQGS